MTKPAEFTQEDWDALTEEEQNGVLEDYDESSTLDDDKVTDGADYGQEEKQQADNLKQQSEQKTDEAKQVEQKQEEEQNQAPAYEYKPKPIFNAELPNDYEGQVKAIREQKRELAKKFDEGEISVAEYQDSLDDLNDKQADLREAKFKASLAQEAQQNQAADDWGTTVQKFLQSHPETSSSDFRLRAFDMAVRMVTGDDANKDMSNLEQLEKAYASFAKEFGIAATENKTPAKQEKRTVPNIGNLPQSDISETDNGRFAALDRLIETDPIKFEETLAKMSAADREAYLAM